MQGIREHNYIIKCEAILKKEDEKSFYAYCPGIPGMFSQDITAQGALDGLRDCVISYIEMALEKGWEIKQNESFSFKLIEATNTILSKNIAQVLHSTININSRENHYQLNFLA
jgi:predicted RNase H-like HicB family nuclease